MNFACPTQGLLRLDWIELSVEEILIKTTTNLILGSFYLASAIYRMYLLMTIFLIFAVLLGYLSHPWSSHSNHSTSNLCPYQTTVFNDVTYQLRLAHLGIFSKERLNVTVSKLLAWWEWGGI